jgi:gliding motility-associated lipoprotein GldH
MIKYCCLAIIILSIVSCDSNRLYESHTSIENEIWNINQVPVFEFNNVDTLSNANLVINVRHTSTYPFSNLWLFISSTDPNGELQKDTVECVLSEKNGKWLGNGLGDIWDIQCQFKTLRLNDDGIYRFEIEQAMRHGNLAKIEQLPGIMEIGLRIEKQQ